MLPTVKGRKERKGWRRWATDGQGKERKKGVEEEATWAYTRASGGPLDKRVWVGVD
jgi:hypothetical protein